MNHNPPRDSKDQHAPAHSTRAVPGSRNSPSNRHGLTPISTSSTATAAQTRSVSSNSESPQRSSFYPSTANTSLNSVAANRQITTRDSSNSSSQSYTSPPPPAFIHTTTTFSAAARSRNAPTAGSSPRLASSLASVSSGVGSAGGVSSRLARHSPSISLSNSAGSPVSSTGGSSTGQLSSLVLTQLNILLSTVKEDSDRAKWETQAEKIRKLVNESGMELFTTYFRRLLRDNASTVFPSAARAPTSGDGYQLLVEEVQKLTKDPRRAEMIAQSFDTSEGDIFREFDLDAFVDHFQLDSIAKTALALPCRAVSKADLRSKADALLVANFQNFLSTLSSPPIIDANTDLPPPVLASIIEGVIQEPPRNWGEEQREHLFYAIRMRFSKLNLRIPAEVESAMLLDQLLASPTESRLARKMQQAGPRATQSLDACKEVLLSIETRDISYSQIANVLLFMVITQNGDAYDPGLFIEAVRQHKAGARIDWTDVVTGFDKEQLRVTKKQFLALYNALLPLAREYANFDIQSLWGGSPWQYAETQLSFVVAFLSTTPDELDVMQIPNLRQAFDMNTFEGASPEILQFAEKAIRHPLVSLEATQALFSMIFRSQETYNIAQSLGIPGNIINQNMTVFVCAASAVAKPWGPLQEQALKQLFYPFLLKQHENYDFVMHALWFHDRNWVAMRMVEFYNQDPPLLTLIYDHAIEHGWLEPLLTITNPFTVDLAAFAHAKGQCNLQEWAEQLVASGMAPVQLARAIEDFLEVKIQDETLVQRENTNPTTAPLVVRSVHALLMLLQNALPDEQACHLYRQCLQFYPRLFNYGKEEKLDSIIDANNAQTNVLPETATGRMEERYKEMYGGLINPDTVVTDLKRLKVSEQPADQEFFAAMLFGLFEEYNCFGEYPNEALATTAVLFGGLVSHEVLSGIAEQAAILMIFKAIAEYVQEDPMYRFGLQALLHVLPRIKEWPHLAEQIMEIPSLRNTAAFEAAENALKELAQGSGAINGENANGIANGLLEEDASDTSTPAFQSIQVDPPLREGFYEDPNEDVSDKIMFVLNNVSKRNLDEKFKEIESAVEEKYHQWFAHYLVDELAKSQPNFQSLYLQLLENFNESMLWAEVLRETYISCQKMINAQSTLDNQHERAIMKNLANWLGSITLARNQPILHRNLSFRDLLTEGHDNGRLLVAIPFTCKTLLQAAHSNVFQPPNPWIEELLGLLSELYHCMDLKLNMKFEIEMLCREFNMDIKAIEPLDIIRSRPAAIEPTMIPAYLPDDPGAFGEMALMGLSKRGPNERFSPEAVIQAVPDLESRLQIPVPVGSITQGQMRSIFVNAAQQAIYEIIAPVVERSVTIASISTAELVQKDFVTEGDENKMRDAAHTMVKALSGSLALVTCKEPLRMSITNNIRILAARMLPDQLPEGQILMFVNDNIDTVCSLVEEAAENHSLAEIDLQLQQATDDRRQHNEQRPNQPFSHSTISRWSTLIPDPYRQDQSGLNRQQLAIYEDFGRQARIPAHGNQGSQDGQRQLPDVLSESFLPSLTTPAEPPAMPRQTGQRLPAMHPVNGFVDSATIGQRVVEMLQELQQASREASEDHVSDIGEGSNIRRLWGNLVGLIENTPQVDNLILHVANQCVDLIYNQAQQRLEVEVFVRLLAHLCRLSPPVCRQITMLIATADDDRVYNAPVTVALQAERLLDVTHIDIIASKKMMQRHPIGLSFLKEVIDELLLGEDADVLRTDFVHSYEALSQWLVEEPTNDLAREIVAKLQGASGQLNGLPSPESDSEKRTDQREYVFEEWIQLQNKGLPLRSYCAFVAQLHEKDFISAPEDALLFFRSSLEYSLMSFERSSQAPFPVSHDAAYVPIDALAKLLSIMVLYQGPVHGETDVAVQVNKAKSLEAIIRLVILVMAEHHNKQPERWNGRVYFRLFSSLLSEIYEHRDQMTAEENLDIHKTLAMAMQVLQPRYFPGFIYPWLGLLTHHLFVPAFLTGSGRTNGGWDTYTRLMTALLSNLGELMVPEPPPVVQDFYRGVLRFFMLLHHDFPDYLIENHMQLNASIPIQCLQLQNMVNSASQSTYIEQPDPFTPGLKINRLEQVRQAPPVHSDVANVLEEAQVKAVIDRALIVELRDQDFSFILSVIDREDGQISSILMNALVLHIGINATPASSVFSSAAPPAKLLERLLRESGANARYFLIVAMVNQMRYVNAHTHYFSTALQHMFGTGPPEIQEQIMRVLCERMMVTRPHPWGLLVMMVEMVKNQNYKIWDLPWVKVHPQVEQMLHGLAQSQEHRISRGSPMGSLM